MLGIIRVLTTDDEKILLEHGRHMWETDQIQTLTRCIQDQPNGIYDRQTEAEAVPKIISLAQELISEPGVDAITISCAADPALQELKEIVDFYIMGAGECGAKAAMQAGRKVAVIGITDTIPKNIKDELGGHFYSYSHSQNLQKTTDLFTEQAKVELLALANKVVNSGADVLLFACTGFSTIRLKAFLSMNIHIPIIDLVEAQAIVYKQFAKEDKG
ncbi:hydantoin racemase [Sporosarcina sp. P26b]|uniref:aspartate/glutamate racemase family protein n=1 Tax=unclassified Sporosarcina TaxID=2647733 RepID=UPI000C1691A4|nr:MULTISPECIES: aspartate/glutamate racemase family protein [unclassified Sporosarcina]PIC73673.1 hydantoin racemase [Sporosarcina sp. P17b]PIC96356.1 hydantoin racemase [Sporosarcina sp. P26b]